MSSLNYLSLLHDLALNNVDLGADSFKVMLVTSSYTPNQTTHTRRSDVTNEVSGAGYAAGGAAATLTVTKVTDDNTVDVDVDDIDWAAASITARAAVLYKSRGGASSADELVSYIDFGGNVVSSGGTFRFHLDTPIILGHP
jgi:hypothetical protein